MYIEVDEDFPSHPKSVRLCSALGNPIAWAYMIKLWAWARKYQKDGDLSAYEPAEIESAIGWIGESGRLFAAAVRAGFIDDGDGIRALHNWMVRSGGGIKRAEDEAIRKRLWRLHKTGKCDRETCAACAAEGNGADSGDADASPSASRPRDVRVNETRQSADGSHQDKTSQGQSRQDPDPISLPFERSGSDPAGARSNSNAALTPFHQRPRVILGACTPAFLAVFDRYPRKDAKQEAAQVFQEIAASYPGGEAALSAAILASFDGGMLEREPYRGPNRTRPFLDKVLATRRWEDPPSAPDDAEPAKPAKPWLAAEKAEDQRKARERMEARGALEELNRKLAGGKAAS